MSAAKHTPGPWEVGSLNQGPISGTIPITTPGYRETFRDGMLIASVYGTAARSEANARLIAAAPEMYEALKLVMQHGRIDDSEHRMNLVAAAVAGDEYALMGSHLRAARALKEKEGLI